MTKKHERFMIIEDLQPQGQEVRVQKHVPDDWDQLDWGVLRRMGARGRTPGRPDKVIGILKQQLKLVPPHGAIFLNPIVTVSAPAPTRAFWRTAWTHRVSWLTHLRQTLGSLRRAL